MLKHISKFVKSKRKQHPTITVFLFAIIIASILIYINSNSNILGHSYRDTYLYLIQALKFSGVNITGYDYVNYLSPLIPFLTAIAFKLGFVSETSIFAITGIFYIIGVIGLYYLLKLRFNDTISAFGAILYGSFSVNLMWTANGTLDIPSMALSILALYYVILAIEKKQKYFYLAFPLAILSFFAKFTGGLICLIMLLYFLSKKDIFRNIRKYFKNAIGGMITGLLLFIPFLGYYFINNIPFGFLNQAVEISSKTTTTATAIAKNTGNQLYFYISNLPRFIYSPQMILGYIVLIIGTIGIIYGLYKFIKYLKNNYSYKDPKIAISFLPKIKIDKEIHYIILILSIIGIGASFFSAGQISFIINEGLFFISIFFLSISFNSIYFSKNKIKEEDEKFDNFNYDLTMIGWFLAYLIFFSAHLTKADRYFTSMAPAFVFFISLGLNTILKKLDYYSYNKKSEYTNSLHEKNLNIIDKIRNSLGDLNDKLKLKKTIPIFCIIILLISTGAYLSIDKHDSLVNNEQEAVNWIIHNDPNYKNQVIWSDRAPDYSWYLQTGIHYVKDSMKTDNLSDVLIANHTDYYITIDKNPKLNGFKELKKFGEVKIYEKDY